MHVRAPSFSNSCVLLIDDIKHFLQLQASPMNKCTTLLVRRLGKHPVRTLASAT